MNEDQIKIEFKNLVETMISMTFGFTPHVKIIVPYANTIQIWIEGEQEERAIIMGKDGKNIAAISRLAFIFARRNNCYVYIYVQPKDEMIQY